LARLAALLLVATLAAGCGWLPKPKDETAGWSASRLYSAARAAMSEGDWETAIKYLETLEARYPFGRYAQQAQLEVAYAYYKYDEPESALAAADRFIKLYPRHPHVDYAWYLKGLINFNRGRGFLDRIFPKDPARLDQTALRQAYRDFGELVRRFPDSRYAPDARQRMVYLRNVMAEHEVVVAEFYMERRAYVAAVNRARQVVERYDGAPAMADALAILVRAYRALDLPRLAADAERVLRLNFPDHPLLARGRRG